MVLHCDTEAALSMRDLTRRLCSKKVQRSAGLGSLTCSAASMGCAITPHLGQQGALHAIPSDLCSLSPSRLPRHDIGALSSHRADLHLLRSILLLASH